MTARALTAALAALAALAPLAPLGAFACGDSPSAAHARQEAIDSWAALRAYGADKREAFTQELDARVALLDRQLDELKARSARASAEAKAAIEQELTSLQSKRSALSERLDGLKQSTTETWNQARDATVEAFESLADGINGAATKFAQ